jgi:hypothetical protein
LRVRAIRRDDIVHHRQWMIRAFAIGIATTRIWLQLFQATGLDFASSFGPAFCISFSLHALIAEPWLRAFSESSGAHPRVPGFWLESTRREPPAHPDVGRRRVIDDRHVGSTFSALIVD